MLQGVSEDETSDHLSTERHSKGTVDRCCSGTSALLVLTAVGALLHGAAFRAGLELARRGLFILGALTLFVSAGALIMDEKTASLRSEPHWKKHFEQLGLFGVLFFAALAVLAVAGLLDAVLYAA